MRALLDVNVLIALLDADHAHHARARAWLKGRAEGWASCPITENGCVRIMSQVAYPNPLPAAAVIERLAGAARPPHHAFWPDDVSMLDEAVADRRRIQGPRQVTDLYLLALAVHRGGTFATFDSGIPLSAIAGATAAHLTVI
jgi:hypothetical protein